MRCTLIALLLVISLQSLAQNKGAKKYNTFKASDKEVVFIDEFNKEERGWLLDVFCEEKSNNTNPRAGVISYNNGKLHYKKVDNFTYSKYVHQVAIDYTKNFEIEVSVLFPDEHIWIRPEKDSLEYNGSLIGIGTDIVNKTKGFYCEFNEYGYSYFWQCNGTPNHSTCTKKNYWKYKKPYNEHGYNLYTIRKIDDYYYFFRNGVFIKKKKYESLTGNYIALGGLYVNNVSYDYVKVAYLPSL